MKIDGVKSRSSIQRGGEGTRARAKPAPNTHHHHKNIGYIAIYSVYHCPGFDVAWARSDQGLWHANNAKTQGKRLN